MLPVREWEDLQGQAGAAAHCGGWACCLWKSRGIFKARQGAAAHCGGPVLPMGERKGLQGQAVLCAHSPPAS